MGRKIGSRNITIITQSAFCARTGIHPKNIHSYQMSGDIVLRDDGKIDIKEEINKKFIKKQKERQKNRKIIGEVSENEDIPIRLLKAEVEKKEADAKRASIKAQREMDVLIHKSIIENVFAEIGKNVRELLFPIGVRTADQVTAMCANVIKTFFDDNEADDELKKKSIYCLLTVN